MADWAIETIKQIAEKNKRMEEKQTYIDNRYRLEVDPKQVEAWELIVMESPRITDWMMVFARYLVNGSGLVSPGLPATPLDELTREERAEIVESKAYKALKHFKLPQLKDAAQSFAQQAVSGF